jgi:ABC-type multidrug transport system fused ATPase/permease subunit
MKEHDKKTTFKKGIAGIIRHSKPYKKNFIILFILGVISAISNGLVPFITGKFFDSLILLSETQNSNDFPLWASLLIVWAIIQIVSNNTDWLIDRISRVTSIKIHMNIQSAGYSRFLFLPISFHKNKQVQGLIDKINTVGWRISSILKDVISIVPQILSVILGLTLVTIINYKLAIILILGVLIYTILLFKIVKKAAIIDEDVHKKWSDAYNEAISPINQIDSVKHAASEEYESEKNRINFMENTYTPWVNLQFIWSNVSFFQKLVVFLTQLSIFIFSVYLIKDNIISVGELIAVNGYALMFFGPFVQLGYSWQTFQNSITSAAQAEDLFSHPVENYEPENAIKKEIEGEVEFKNVFFKYEDGNTVLHDINLKINKGESVALVGKSGSGKSTFVSLVCGYFFPNAGSITIDKVNTNQYSLTNLRKQIAIVPQEIALFNDTIENNIKYGNFDATIEEVIHAAKEAHLHDFILEQKDEYKTLVGERGVKLSVGQKQRLAIARAILRNPKILILDEPTSALDAMTEKFVTESLSKLMKHRTTIIIAHRLSTVRQADKIVVFEKGQIVETGNHQELSKKENGHYKQLHDYQSGVIID